jgi:hypothetical protein
MGKKEELGEISSINPHKSETMLDKRENRK